MTARLSITTIVVALFCASPAVAASELDQWFSSTLLPHVEERLTRHPRFRGENLLFVALRDGQIEPVSNRLVLGLRDRLLDAAIDMPGVRIAWQQRGQTADRSCRPGADYWIGIELEATLSGQYRASVRALDRAEKTWVSGFGLSWQGTLRPSERRALDETRSDPAFLGSREVPYALDQSDLMAAELARKLRCKVASADSTDYTVTLAEAAESEQLANTLALAARKLDQANALRITSDENAANAEISGTALKVSGSLHQYWLRVAPLDTASGLNSMSTSVYVDTSADTDAAAGDTPVAVRNNDARRVPEAPFEAPRSHDNSAGPRVPDSRPSRLTGVEMPGAARSLLLRPLALYRDGRQTGACRTGTACAVLETRAVNDVLVYPLVYRPGIGLTRLATGECMSLTHASIVTAGRSALYPVPEYGRARRDGQQSHRWLLSPARTTYYAIAVDNARDARRLSTHIASLPSLCDGVHRPGLSGLSLERWLEQLSHLMLELKARVQWQSIEIDGTYPTQPWEKR